MGNLSFILHCADGGVLASDLWGWPTNGTADDIKPIGEKSCVLLHGPDQSLALEALKYSQLESVQDRPFPDVVGEAAKKVFDFATQRAQAKQPFSPFGFLIVGYFRGSPDLHKVDVAITAPGQPPNVMQFAHNVFNGASDIARALDAKFPARGLTVELALPWAAFCILQSHNVYFTTVGPRFALAVLTQESGLRWIEEEDLTRIQREASLNGLRFSRMSMALFGLQEQRGP